MLSCVFRGCTFIDPFNVDRVRKPAVRTPHAPVGRSRRWSVMAVAAAAVTRF